MLPPTLSRSRSPRDWGKPGPPPSRNHRMNTLLTLALMLFQQNPTLGGLSDQEAINFAQPGSIVYVGGNGPGSHNLVVTKPLTLIALPIPATYWQSVTIRCHGGAVQLQGMTINGFIDSNGLDELRVYDCRVT